MPASPPHTRCRSRSCGSVSWGSTRHPPHLVDHPLDVLKGYFDESGTQPSKPVVTVAGVLFTPANLRRLSRWWRRHVRSAHIKEFKAAACTEGTGEFANWSENDRHALRLELARKIDTLATFAVAVTVIKRDFNDIIVPLVGFGSDFGDPYLWAMRTCLEDIAASEHRRGQRVACVFDEGYGKFPQAVEHFGRVRRIHQLEGVFHSNFTTYASVNVPCLQAADLMAYEIRHHFEKTELGIPKRYPGLGDAFTRLDIDNNGFRADGLRQIRNNILAETFCWKLDYAATRANQEAWEAWCAEEDRAAVEAGEVIRRSTPARIHPPGGSGR
jgi:hypothetical protein